MCSLSLVGLYRATISCMDAHKVVLPINAQCSLVLVCKACVAGSGGAVQIDHLQQEWLQRNSGSTLHVGSM